MAAVVCAVASASALADHTAVAVYDDKTVGGWGTGASARQAEVRALMDCKAKQPLRKCSILYTAAVALATDNEGLAATRSFHSREEAEQKALAGCGVPACEVVATVVEPGFYALFHVKDGESLVGVYLSHGQATQAEAVAHSQQACEQRDGYSCTVQLWGAIRGDVPEGEAPKAWYAVQSDAE